MDDIIPDAKDMSFNANQIYSYKWLDNYFKSINEDLLIEMINIINSKSVISLRLLDWFVTRYCKKHKVIYNLNNNLTDNSNSLDKLDNLNIYISYKAQLKAYHKQIFDPFRRGAKFYYPCKINNETIKLETTLAQLQFFQWLFQNKIIDYVKDNLGDINKAMNVFNKRDKEEKKKRKTERLNKKIKDTTSSDSIKSLKQDFETIDKITLTFD